jgi:hypothetical protein
VLSIEQCLKKVESKVRRIRVQVAALGWQAPIPDKVLDGKLDPPRRLACYYSYVTWTKARVSEEIEQGTFRREQLPDRVSKLLWMCDVVQELIELCPGLR